MLERIDQEQWDAIINQTYDLEFDWIAFDQDDQIGVFSSFNRGYISAKVKLSFELYNKLFNLIDSLPHYTLSKLVTNELGNFDDWQQYSRKGLYAFDFQDIHRTTKLQRYDIISIPEVPLKATQINGIECFLDIIPRYNLVFGSDLYFQQLIKSEA